LGLAERLGQRTTQAVPILVPVAWQPAGRITGAIMLQPLGPNGFGLRDPRTGAGIPQERLEELGAVVTPLMAISSLRDDAKREASPPGHELLLVPVVGGVTVRDASGQVQVGELDRDLARAVIAAQGLGTRLRAISLWETCSVGGRRTGLDILIAPEHVEIILATE
jgi:hypothetical protein